MPLFARSTVVFMLLNSMSAILHAAELGIDAAYSGSTLIDDYGFSSHVQLIGNENFGLDFGYQWVNSLTYDAIGATVSHSMSQYELGLIWQAGEEGYRFQFLGGGIFSADTISVNNQDLITQFAPGWQVGAGVSVPVFSRFRVFGEVGYQNWLDAEIPGSTRWRYGLRMLLGGNTNRSSEEESIELQQSSAADEQALLDATPTTSNAEIPQYIPSYMSQSLPPIVTSAELCKCFPAGPYTLQLGEFNNMAQAVRALEYRGLRQFFNSRAYQREPLPVFLSQPEEAGVVNIFLGEMEDIAALQYWQTELRKNGLGARFRKIVGTEGLRSENHIVELEESEYEARPSYTPEQIQAMNSLSDEELALIDPDSEYIQLLNSLPEGELAPQMSEADREQLNSLPPTRTPMLLEPEDAVMTPETEGMDMDMDMDMDMMNQVQRQSTKIQQVLQVGPLTAEMLADLLLLTDMQRVLATDDSMARPTSLMLHWDEAAQQAWLVMDDFDSQRVLDEWNARLLSEGVTTNVFAAANIPLGDIYTYELGVKPDQFSVEIDREASIQNLLGVMRSPEVLWFQAFQRINGNPLITALNFSMVDQRYRLIATGMTSAQERQQVWQNLSNVGLLPSLAEE